MNNLLLPAYPIINQEGESLEDRAVFYGFTELELASIMIAQGNMTQGGVIGSDQIWADRIVSLAKVLLEEANK